MSEIAVRRILFWTVFVVNLCVVVYGFFFFYAEQFMDTNPLLWVFVPDCPMYVLFFALTMLFLRFKKGFHFFYFVSFVGVLKYAFWTIFVMLAFPGYYFAPSNVSTNAVLLVMHALMFFEAFLLLGKINTRNSYFFIAMAWFFLNDLFDYLLGTHPPVPAAGEGVVFVSTLFMTLFFSLFGHFAQRRLKKIVDIFPDNL